MNRFVVGMLVALAGLIMATVRSKRVSAHSNAQATASLA